MNGELAARYYRLALSAAARRDLSSAVAYARYTCLLNTGHENAAKLLGLCLHEMGEPNEEYDAAADEFEQIRPLIQRKKWRAARRLARSIPHQSVRVLNIQGCLCACSKRYGTAARFFAKALEKDSGNRLALSALTEVTTRRKQL